jgi:hypothetical protein
MTDVHARADFGLTIAGVRLVPAQVGDGVTIEQNGWITAKLERVGLADPALVALAPIARAEEVRLRILESGQIAPLLAGFLVAEGQPWSADAARRHAQLLDSAAAGLERELLFAMVEGLVQGFFGKPPASPESSPTSSTSPGGDVPKGELAEAESMGSSTTVIGTV